ncbi:MAG: TFIIB-type zinc ribbon-containing protein, partial [Acidilobus sp.]
MSGIEPVGGRRCPICGGEMVEDDGRLVCPSCGYVLDESPISDQPEWRYFSAGGVKGLERASMANDMLRHDYGISVHSFVASRNRSVLKRVAPLRSRIARPHPIMKGESTAVEIFTIANDAASHFELPQTTKDFMGALLHAYVEKAKRPVGREKAQIVAAALEKVVEVYNLGISKGEIKAFFDIDDNDLWEGVRRLSESGALDIVKRAEADRFKNSTDRVLERTLTYITRIVSALNLPHNLTQQ